MILRFWVIAALFATGMTSDLLFEERAFADECLGPMATLSYGVSALPSKIQKANTSLDAYLTGARSRLLEREFLLQPFVLLLLAKEHGLLMGPPGNAKSLFADLLLSNIVEVRRRGKKVVYEPSYYSIQMTPETTMSETHGPLDYKTLTKRNRYVRLYEEGMLMSRNVFIDEIGDTRPNTRRNILGMLAERMHKQGPRRKKGKIEVAFAATNRYLSELYETAGDDSPRALLDRFAACAFVPGEFEFMDSYVELIQSAKKSRPVIPQLTFDELDLLREKVEEVEIPRSVAEFMAVHSLRYKMETEALEQSSLKTYRQKLRDGEEAPPPYRATKFYSPRTIDKSAGILKAIVVMDWLAKGGNRPLEATFEDIRGLEQFATLIGPSDEFVKDHMTTTSNPHDRAQYFAINTERESFRRLYNEVMTDMNQTKYDFALDEAREVRAKKALNAEDRGLVAKRLIQFIVESTEELNGAKKTRSFTGKHIGTGLARDSAYRMLRELLGEKKAAAVQREIDRQTKLKGQSEKPSPDSKVKTTPPALPLEGRAALLAKFKDGSAFETVSSVLHPNLDVRPAFTESPTGQIIFVRKGNSGSEIGVITASGTQIHSTDIPANIQNALKASPKSLFSPADEVLIMEFETKAWVVDLKSWTHHVLNLPSQRSTAQLSVDRQFWVTFDFGAKKMLAYDWKTGAKLSLKNIKPSSKTESNDWNELVDAFEDASLQLSKDRLYLVSKNMDQVLKLDLANHEYTYSKVSSAEGLAFRRIEAQAPKNKSFGFFRNGNQIVFLSLDLENPSLSRVAHVTSETTASQFVVVNEGEFVLNADPRLGITLIDLTDETEPVTLAMGTAGWVDFLSAVGQDKIVFGQFDAEKKSGVLTIFRRINH